VVVTPWSVERLPQDDLDDLLFKCDLAAKLGRVEGQEAASDK